MAETSAEPAEVLAAAIRRRELLATVRADPCSPAELRDRLDAARSTVYRAVRELAALGLVEESGGEVRLTVFGQLVVARTERAFESVAGFCESERQLAQLPASLPVPVDVFEGAEVVTAEPRDADLPVEAFVAAVREADRLVAVSPMARARFVRLFREGVLDRRAEIRIVTEPTVVEYLLSTYRETLEGVLEAENLEFYESDDGTDLRFEYIVAAEPREYLALNLYDDRGHLRAFVRNDSPAAVAWGRERFESVVADATLLN